MADSNWFYTDANTVQQGPVSGSALLGLNREGGIQARSLVWREGLPDWVPFLKVAPELFAEEARAAATEGGDEDLPTAEIGVCVQSGRIYPLRELLPYGEALVGPEHKDAFVRRMMERGDTGIADATDQPFAYVGFWWRVLAASLDYMIKLLPSGLFMVPYYFAIFYEGAVPSEDEGSIRSAIGMGPLTLAAYGFGLLGTLALSIAYDTWMVGRYQATLGKIVIGARVVNPDGSRLTYKRAFWRWFVKKVLINLIVWGPSTLGFILVVGAVAALSRGDGATILLTMTAGLFAFAALLALCSGVYWMAAFDPEKRALHDRLASTRVVRRQA
jgi:uncharacterized RDD family membrane protein YckC